MDRGPNRRNKAPSSNSSGVVWTGPQKKDPRSLNVTVSHRYDNKTPKGDSVGCFASERRIRMNCEVTVKWHD